MTKYDSNSETEEFNLKKEIFSYIEMIVETITIVALIFTFVVRLATVDGKSMVPTLYHGEKLFITNWHGDLKHNDIVVIKRKGDTPLVKRIIAVENDKIDINYETGEVFLNDKLLDEPFIAEKTYLEGSVDLPVTVPKGHYFVMGDNRNHSDDSRKAYIGMIDERNIFGKAIFRLFPINRFGSIYKKN